MKLKLPLEKGVIEELIIEPHRMGYSISEVAEMIDVPIADVMEVLFRLDEESDVFLKSKE